MFRKLFPHFNKGVAIDLGTANSLVYVEGKGIVINEPSVIALNKKTGQILAVGHEAKMMVGRTPSHINAVKPLTRGVISDFEVAEQMLRYFMDKVREKKLMPFSWPKVVVGIPCGSTEVERKAVEDAAKNAGAMDVFLIEEPVAAAIGARLPVQEPKGTFIIDIGGGTTDIAVISLGGIVHSKNLTIAGDKLSEDIVQYVQQKYKLLIGERSADEAKIKIGSAIPQKETKELALRGRNLITGLPEEIVINSEDIRQAIEKSLEQMVSTIKDVIEATPPDLIADVMRNGIYMVGGGSLLRGIDVLVSEETKMPVTIIEDPLTAVVRGGGVVLESFDDLREILADIDRQEIPRQK